MSKGKILNAYDPTQWVIAPGDTEGATPLTEQQIERLTWQGGDLLPEPKPTLDEQWAATARSYPPEFHEWLAEFVRQAALRRSARLAASDPAEPKP